MASPKPSDAGLIGSRWNLFRWGIVLLCVFSLAACGDFNAIFNKKQRHRTASRKTPSAHDKGRTTAARKTRGGGGRVLAGFFIWPVEGEISSSFGNRDGHPHDGIDIRAPKGTPIHASASGEVVYSGNMSGYGNLILIKHRDNYFTAYAHCDERLVKEGKQVEQGDVIGKVGDTGHATGYHLHFEIRAQSTPMDPVAFLPSSKEPATLIGKRDKPKEGLANEGLPKKEEGSDQGSLPFPYDL